MPQRIKHSFHNGLEQKYCSGCSQWKNLDLFFFKNSNWDKLTSQCKKCRNIKKNQRRANFTAEQRENYLAQARNQVKRYRDSGRRDYVRNLKYKNDPKYAMLCRLRNRLTKVLKSKGIVKTNTTMMLCGCSLEELKAHLQKQFLEGMSWKNRSEWHIDHIRPCASFDLTDIEQQKQCFHYSNLQPLFAADNLRKSDKYDAK